jgi:putative ABC transport system permease protein
VIWQTLLMALRELKRNKMRSILTMLGIIIGVAAVIALVSIGQGATEQITGDIGKLGKNMLIVSQGADRRGGAMVLAPPLEMDDAQAIEHELSSIAASAPSASTNGLVVHGNANWRTTITGSTPEYFFVRDYKLASGRAFTASEQASGRSACVLGATVKKELFGSQDPLGELVRIGRVSCQVIGVLEGKGQSTVGSDQDDIVVMPLLAFQRRISGTRDVPVIFVSAKDGHSTTLAKSQIEGLLRQRRRIDLGEEDDFQVRDLKEFVDLARTTTGVLTALLGAIAAVSLVGGGIGNMNIMLVSVTERTREIGIRLAIGARGHEVLTQFLVEAIVLSTIGGTIGMGLGLLGSWATTRALSFPFVVMPDVMAGAFVFSALVGVAFGFLPARKAARLNPIEALRHE